MKQAPVKTKLCTIALATRGRIDQLKRLLDSIKNTTRNPQDIEVMLGADLDDPELKDILILAGNYPFDVLVLAQKRAPNISDDYLNRMFAAARGYWLWIMNDDVEFKRNWWDVLLQEIVRNRTPICIDTMDNTRNFNNNGQFACFPIMNRPLFQALGYFYHPEIPTWGADKWLSDVCHLAGCIVERFDLEVYHHMTNEDEAHYNMMTKSKIYGCGGQVDREGEAEKIRRYRG